MDPNLRTLSLSAWMSLPGLDFSTWEAANPQIPYPPPLTTESGFKRNIIQRNGKYDSQLGSATQQSISDQHQRSNKCAAKKSKNILECRKCVELREKQKVQYPPLLNNNESEVGALCCKCSKAASIQQKSQVDGKTYNIRKITTTNGTILEEREATDQSQLNITPIKQTNNNITMITLPKRNLSLQRQVSKEVQTRALVSRVAEYYESYSREMGLSKFFVNDTVVTSIQPLTESKCKNARWIVNG